MHGIQVNVCYAHSMSGTNFDWLIQLLISDVNRWECYTING